VSGFKHDNRLKCHRGIVSQWTFQVGLNVTVDETWVDVTSRHHTHAHTAFHKQNAGPYRSQGDCYLPKKTCQEFLRKLYVDELLSPVLTFPTLLFATLHSSLLHSSFLHSSLLKYVNSFLLHSLSFTPPVWIPP
jgi:hypothetical protein